MKEEYFHEDNLSPYHSKFKLRLGVFLAFLFVIILLIFTTVYGGFSFTGGAVVNFTDEKIEIDADLTIPSLKLEGSFEKVKIKGISSSLYAGDQRFFLENFTNNYVTLENYSGEIFFDNESINEFRGKADKVFINGVPVTSDSGKSIKIYFDEPSDYDVLEIKEDVSIKKLSYITTGRIVLYDRKNIFDVNNEEVALTGFVGGLRKEGNKFSLEGYVDSLEIFGEHPISVGI